MTTTQEATRTADLGGARYADLNTKGQAAVDANNARHGVTMAGLIAELENGMTAQSIAQGKAWYPETRAFNAGVAKRSGLTLAQVTAITALVSPQMQWPENKRQAVRIATTFRAFDHLDCAKAAADAMRGMMTANLAPAIAVARGGDIATLVTGIKRHSFMLNMLYPGRTGAVTVDTHMQRAAMRAATVPMTLAQSIKYLNANRGVTDRAGAGYVAIAEAVRTVAARHGLAPDQVQAAYWIAVSGSPDGASGRTR